MQVREAQPADRIGVRRVLDAAMLEVDELPGRIESGDVLVAVETDSVLGAVVLVPPEKAPPWVVETGVDVHVDAIAVRRRRRSEGIGRALVERASERGALSAAFQADVRPFYEDLGFEIMDGKTADGRLRGVWWPGTD